MITIDQLLESVDLDFEPRWVTKDSDMDIAIWSVKPAIYDDAWGTYIPHVKVKIIGCIKLSEFENKPWQECIYEVPRKTTEKLKHIERIDDSFVDKINAIIDAVNELKGAKNESKHNKS